MKLVDAPFAGASKLLERDPDLERAYRGVLKILRETSVPPQSRQKASPLFIYDQRELQRIVREQLRSAGFRHGRALSPDTAFDTVRIPGIQADMIGHDLHVLLDFGNRASWAHNLVTRVLGGFAMEVARLTVLVTPTDAFARHIDTNLGTFERVASSVRLMERWRPESLPGPIVVVGVSADGMDGP